MKTYTVLLVDDEEDVIQVIMKKINWEGLGFSVIGYANNGVKALEMVEEYQPDVVMTDIKMPYMDGLTLSRKLKELYRTVKIIIFSGFDEFEYAKEAVHLEVEEYIYQNTEKKKKREKEKTADQLSKGNQQKIQLMAALLSEPELVVLDEPLSGLDPVNADLFKSIIRELMEKQVYLIMSSHQMETIEEFCSDITILNRGNAVLQGNLNEIKKSYGRINMIVKCEGDIEGLIRTFELNVLKRTPDGYHLRVSGEEQAMGFLTALVKEKIPVVRFELREPSLHEIFVEKVGTANE